MPYSPVDAQSLLCETAIDSVVDHAEPYELCKLRERLCKDRESLQEHLENPDSPYASLLGLGEHYWMLRFSWADLQDYVEEANNKVLNDEAGFRSEWFCVKELACGCIVPDRPRIHRRQTLDDYVTWGQAEQKDEFPIFAWEEEDYLAATEVDDEDEDEERIPWEDYDQDDLNKMDRQLSRGY